MKNKGSHGVPKIATRTFDFDPKEMAITITTRLRKISRKRLIGLIMYCGVPARIARKMADDRIPMVCIGSFRGIEELRKFGSTLRGYLVEGVKLSADIRDAYRQITRAIDAVEA